MFLHNEFEISTELQNVTQVILLISVVCYSKCLFQHEHDEMGYILINIQSLTTHMCTLAHQGNVLVHDMHLCILTQF